MTYEKAICKAYLLSKGLSRILDTLYSKFCSVRQLSTPERETNELYLCSARR